MIFYCFTLIVAGLPVLYPLCKLLRKCDLTAWDLLLMSSTLYFCIIPVTGVRYLNVMDEAVADVFWYNAVFSYMLVACSVFWDKHYKNKESIINITTMLKNYDYDLSFYGKVLVVVLIGVCFVFYIPKQSMALSDIDDVSSLERGDFIVQQVLGVVYSVVSTIIFYVFSSEIKKNRCNWFYVVLTIVVLIGYSQLRRRPFMLALLALFVFFYSLNREKITRRFVLVVSLLLVFMMKFYMPFFNVVRFNDVVKTGNPVEDIVNVFNYGINHWNKDKERAQQLTDGRSVNVYKALFDLCRQDYDLGMGHYLYKEIDVAIPKFFNPNKGEGSAKELEILTKNNTDIADSIFLECCADFGQIGSVVTLFVYFLIYFMYDAVYRLVRCSFLKIHLSYFLFIIISMCWNIEGTFGSCIARLFHLSVVLFALFFVEYMRFIRLRKIKIVRRV